MAFFSRLPSALIVIFLTQCLNNVAVAIDSDGTTLQNGTSLSNPTTSTPPEASEPPLLRFGDVIQAAGNMERTNQEFRDGLAVDFFSLKALTFIVNQNTRPLGAEFITGSAGEPFVALQNYSYIISTNGSAQDLIAKIEVPHNLEILKAMGVNPANTYIAKLATDKRSWVIDEQTRNVHVLENNIRIIKMTSINGEYMLVGRQVEDMSNSFVQFGQGPMRTVNMTGGARLQEAEFVDGLRFSVQSQGPMTFNVNIKPGINPGTLPANTEPLNSYAWVVNSSAPFERVQAQMLVPFNRTMLIAMRPAGSSPSTMLQVYKRPLNATSGSFLPINGEIQVVHELPEDRILVPLMTQLDGIYTILVTTPLNVGKTGALTLSAIQKPVKRETKEIIVENRELMPTFVRNLML